MKMNIVDALRASGTEMHEEAADEIERLTEALRKIANYEVRFPQMPDVARAALGMAPKEEPGA
jgi:hypothetical protein